MDHYCKGMGQRSPDLTYLWGDFRDKLSNRFFGKCGYCERRCDGPANAPTVDHFRPRSKFPELAYVWSNWVFACFRCNDIKANLWPDSGYVDPCAIPPDERPDIYFEVDVRTGDVIAKAELTESGKRKAQNTIDDLGLNLLDLRYSRIGWIRDLTAILSALPTPDREAFAADISGPDREFAGITGMLLERLRQMGEL